MPRHYERKIEVNPKYSAEELQAAIELYKNERGTAREISMNHACDLGENRKIPLTTFRRHLKYNSCPIGSGRPPVLTEAEEQYLVYGLQCLADYGWGIGVQELQEIVANFVRSLNRKNPFKGGVPGHDWLHDFCHRWNNELSLRKPEYLTTARANAITEETHSKFMEVVNNVLDRLGIKDKPEQQYNCDEVGMRLDPKLRKVFARRGAKNVSVVVPTEGKEQITVLVCGNAAGEYLPPFTVVCENIIFSFKDFRNSAWA